MFKLPDLPYAADALEPHISRLTMETHHGKHHAAYIKKTNDALKERPGAPASLEAVVRLAAGEKEKALFNNAAQAWNHGFFWNCLSPESQGVDGALKRAIEREFKSFAAFHDEFVSAGEKHFASGWVWLVADEAGLLSIRDLHDAATPITDAKVTPIIVCDVWEHAYYLDYKNDRASFLRAFVEKLANWRFAERQYDAARNGGAGAWAFPV